MKIEKKLFTKLKNEYKKFVKKVDLKTEDIDMISGLFVAYDHGEPDAMELIIEKTSWANFIYTKKNGKELPEEYVVKCLHKNPNTVEEVKNFTYNIQKEYIKACKANNQRVRIDEVDTNDLCPELQMEHVKSDKLFGAFNLRDVKSSSRGSKILS